MWVGVLGELVARDDRGDLLGLGGPARRRLLAALTARVGRAVPARVLVEDIWGDAPPRSAQKTLQSHVLRLRRDLGGSEAEGPVRTEAAGYRLDLSPLAVDSGCFERDLRLGLAALGEGHPERAREQLDAAHGWWRGDAYAEFTDAQFAVAERLRLGELHALAYERRFDVGLVLGEHAELSARIEQRLLVDPYRERLWEQLMLALYRDGRQSDALAAFRRVRTLLGEDLGLDPGPGLRRLESQVLAHDQALRGPRSSLALTGRASAGEAPVLCPYRGLARYEAEDGPLFVAREALTARLVARVDDTDLVTVAGASGTGKSSLVRAGLLAALRAGALPGSATWRCAVTSPQDLAAVERGGLDLLVLDQAEELFTLGEAVPAPDEADHLLTAAMAAGTRVVLVVRSDFYGRLAELPQLHRRVGASTLLVAPLDDGELRRVVTEPARRVGLELEPSLLEAVLDDVRGRPGALPLLSTALVRTWENRDASRLTLEGYRRGGGVRGALEAVAEGTFLALDDTGQAQARRLLVRLAAEEGGRWTRRPLPREDAATVADAPTLEALGDGRLVTISESRVELVHEALLDGWPRLRAWLERRYEIAGLLEHLDAASRSWAAGGRQDADLYRGARLQGALDWRREEPEELTALEAAFLDAGAEAAEAELVATRRRAEAEARGRRRLRWVAAGLAVVTALAAAGAVVALRERRSAQAAATAADAQKVAAISLTAPDLRTSLLLATAAFRIEDSTDTRSALLSALERSGSALWRIPTTGRVDFLGVSADGSDLWVTNQRRTVFRYDLSRRTLLGSFPARADETVAVSPDGRQLVVAGPDGFFDRAGAGRVSVLDARSGSLVRVLPVTADADGSTWTPAAYTRDGRWLAVVEGAMGGAGPGTTVAVFDTRDLSARPRLLHEGAAVTELAAGRADLAVGTVDGGLAVVRAADGRVLARAHRPDLARGSVGTGSPYAVALSPDGRELALTVPDRPTVPYLLDVTRLGGTARAAEDLGGDVASLAFSPTGRLLAVSAQTGALDVDRVADARVVLRPLGGLPGQSQQLAWSGTATTDTGLYTGGLDGQVLSRDLRAGPRLVAYSGPGVPDQAESFLSGQHVITVGATAVGASTGSTPVDVTDIRTGATRTITVTTSAADSIQGASTDAAGRELLLETQGPDQVIRSTLLDLGSGRVLSTFTATDRPTSHNTYVGILSPDGRTAAFAVGDHRLATYAVPGWRPLTSFDVHFRERPGDSHLVSPIAFAPDGRLLVTGYDPAPTPTPPSAADVGRPAPTQPAEDELVGLVDLRSRRLVGQAGGFGVVGIADAAAWSPDGSRLAVGTLAGTVRVLDARALAPVSDAVVAVSGVVQTVSWSPDGSTVVVGGSDGTLGFWSPTLRPVGSAIRSSQVDSWWAWFAPDGSVVGYAPSDVGGQERWFRLPADPARWARLACGLAGDDLTRAEWRRYVGTRLAYRPVC